MPESREMVKQTDWQAKWSSQMAVSEDAKFWGAWDTKPRTSHRRSPGGERSDEVLDDLFWKDERAPSSVRWTLEPFQRQLGETSERHGGAHMGFSEHIDTILNWTEQMMPYWQRLLLRKKWTLVTCTGRHCCKYHWMIEDHKLFKNIWNQLLKCIIINIHAERRQENVEWAVVTRPLTSATIDSNFELIEQLFFGCFLPGTSLWGVNYCLSVSSQFWVFDVTCADIALLVKQGSPSLKINTSQ